MAFSANLPEDLSARAGYPQPIPFTHILLNHGSWYNPETYTFTAPGRGIYFFTIGVGPLEKGLVIIQVNGELVSAACTHAHTGAWYTGDATSAMMFLEVGDQVWLTAQLLWDRCIS